MPEVRVFIDEEEYEADIDENGNIALLEEEPDDGEDIDDNDVEDPELEEAIEGVIVEAILNGKLPSDDTAFSHATQRGLELGIVVNTTQGLMLASDAEAQGLELGYASNFDKIRGFGKSLHATGMRGGAKRMVARTIGRAKTAGRAATDFSNATVGKLKQHGQNFASNTKQMYGAHKGKLAAAGAGTAVGFGAGRASHNPLVADAERRSAKK